MKSRLNGGMAGLILAKIVCCVGLLLVISGVLSLNAIGALLFDGGLVWPVATVALGAAALFLFRWRKNRNLSSTATGGHIGAEHSR